MKRLGIIQPEVYGLLRPCSRVPEGRNSTCNMEQYGWKILERLCQEPTGFVSASIYKLHESHRYSYSINFSLPKYWFSAKNWNPLKQRSLTDSQSWNQIKQQRQSGNLMVMNFCERKWGEDFIENICQQPCNFLVPLPSLFSCAKSSSVFLCGTTLYLGKGIIKYEEASQTSSGERLDLLHKSCEIMAH